jgi:hypothetical protein
MFSKDVLALELKSIFFASVFSTFPSLVVNSKLVFVSVVILLGFWASSEASALQSYLTLAIERSLLRAHTVRV